MFAKDGSDKVYLCVGRLGHQRLTGQVRKLSLPIGVLHLCTRLEEEVEVAEVVGMEGCFFAEA